MDFTNELVPTGIGMCSSAGKRNGFRYIQERRMERHSFYLKKSWGLLKHSGVDGYTVKPDAFTTKLTQPETTKELLNWQDGRGSWRSNTTEYIKFPIEESLMKFQENHLLEIHEHKTQPIDLTIKNKYDMDKLCGYIERAHENYDQI